MEMQLNPIMILVCFLGGALGAYCGYRKGQNLYIWFCVGFFLGAIGLILMHFFFPKREKVEQKPAQIRLKNPEIWSNLWYYLDLNQMQQGPHDFPALIKIWNEKEISENSFIWTEGMPAWQTLDKMPDLIDELAHSQQITTH